MQYEIDIYLKTTCAYDHEWDWFNVILWSSRLSGIYVVEDVVSEIEIVF